MRTYVPLAQRECSLYNTSASSLWVGVVHNVLPARQSSEYVIFVSLFLLSRLDRHDQCLDGQFPLLKDWFSGDKTQAFQLPNRKASLATDLV